MSSLILRRPARTDSSHPAAADDDDDGEEEEAAFNRLSLFVSTEVSSERSPRRRSISGLGSSDKSVAVDNPNSSPFKVPVSNRHDHEASVSVTLHLILHILAADFALGEFYSEKQSLFQLFKTN